MCPARREHSAAPLRNALKILPAATVVVAMSRSQGSSSPPGTDMQMGLVPSRPSRPCHGGTMAEALHITMPMRTFGGDLLRPEGRAAEVVRFSRRDQSDAMLLGEPDRVLATDVRDDLAQAVLAVVEQAAAAFGNDAPLGATASDLPPLQPLQIEGQQLNAVRIHAAQVGGHQGGWPPGRLSRRARPRPREGFWRMSPVPGVRSDMRAFGSHDWASGLSLVRVLVRRLAGSSP